MNFQEKFCFCPVCGSNKFETNDIKSKKCNNCNFSYYINPSAATAVFILNNDNELLVCRRGKEPSKGTLDLPGGFIDFDETAEQGACREVKEETGIELREIKYLFSIPNDYLFSDLNIPTMDLFFEAKLTENKTPTSNDDVAEALFIPLEEINIELFGLKSIREAVKTYLKKEKNRTKKTYLA